MTCGACALTDGSRGPGDVPLGGGQRGALPVGGSECGARSGARRAPPRHRLHPHFASEHAGPVCERRELRDRQGQGTKTYSLVRILVRVLTFQCNPHFSVVCTFSVFFYSRSN